MNRREMLRLSGSAVAATAVLGLPAVAQGLSDDGNQPSPARRVLVIGAHPDDPETGCGGTMLLLHQAGYEVVCVYLTRGEAGIAGKSHDEAAAIRVRECEAACRITGARHIFMSQIDGNTEVNRQRYAEMRELIERENPVAVLTHWPIDAHRDHAVCGMLVLDAWRRLGRRFRLFYFEVMSGEQTQMFSPTHIVDITAVSDLKRRACLCHESQNLEPIFDGWHTPMELFRGIQGRCQRGEAFMQHDGALPGLLV
ncbi:MAG: PIG-L family deacetylase [Muribaculaceae bacterium]|nr:PIG-L family deacetylase [Muribaculaceae bacterium]